MKRSTRSPNGFATGSHSTARRRAIGLFEHHGHGDLGRKLNKMTKEGKWDQIAAEIPDDVLHDFAAIARYDQLQTAVEKRFGGAADAIYASTSQDIRPAIPAEVLQDMARIPTAFQGFSKLW